MPLTYIPIQSITTTGTPSTITFSSIPQTYTDLVVRFSIRDSYAGTDSGIYWYYNTTGPTGYGITNVYGLSGVAYSDRDAGAGTWYASRGGVGNTATTNTYNSGEIYIPNYTGSTKKPASAFNVGETNAANGVSTYVGATLWNNTAAVTSITFQPTTTTFLAGCTLHLYGIKKD